MSKIEIKPPKAAECPAWMMTFGDCMSLLVCFFVMLIAFSNMEEEQLAAMIGAMRGALGGVAPISETREHITPQRFEMEADGLTTIEGDAEQLRFLTVDEMSELLPQMISELRLSLRETPTEWPDRLLIQMIDEGLTIVVHTRAIFKNGTTEFIAEQDPLWEGIARLMHGRANPIRIVALVGANTTIETDRVRSIWGLGLERAEAVTRRLEGTMKAPSSRFGVGVQVRSDEQFESVEITILGENPPAEEIQQNEWLLEAWR